MFVYCIMDYKNIISVHKSKQKAEKLLGTLNSSDTRLSMPIHIREGYPRFRIREFSSAKEVLLLLEQQKLDLTDIYVHALLLRQEEINRELRTNTKKNFFLTGTACLNGQSHDNTTATTPYEKNLNVDKEPLNDK